MKNSLRIEGVIEFVGHWHKEQKRKFTGEPYVTHLIDVGQNVILHTNNELLQAAALCHDLYEDTACSEKEFFNFFLKNGFSQQDTHRINSLVHNLTDEYIKSNYPHLNRRKRKTLEAKRLSKTQPDAQTIKYADMIDNSKALVIISPDFASTYLREMQQILAWMDQGHKTLFKMAKKQCQEQLDLLKKH